ncbi:MAG: porphobilinogen synthase [Deltaproteobacteria bacterium]|nr:porphobilinogen synthase [Deltaproteobacteria bacterium]
MSHPMERPRRLRLQPVMRQMLAEAQIRPSALIQPVFVVEGTGIEAPIPRLPGVSHYSVDRLVDAVRAVADAGIRAVLLFGVPGRKDAQGSAAWASDGVVQRACAALRERCPGLILMTDLCLCAYTDHGHCGVVRSGCIDNDATLALLAETALSQAKAGAHVVAPSDMMDGRVGAIRTALDAAAQHDVAIMSYAVKYASAFYGPFREAQHSSPHEGDRRSYQMDPARGEREALREVRLDIEEGADMVMVKPALPYLDILRAVREASQVPVVAYQVSGEYAMIEAAAQAGSLDRTAALWESLTAIHRAGADLIITYAAAEMARKMAVDKG